MAWKSQYANEYILAATSYGADAATFHQTGPSLVLSRLTVGYKQPGIVRQRATSLSATTAVRVSVFCFVAFRILSVTFSLTRALSQSLAHVQQRFTAPRVCTLVLSLQLYSWISVLITILSARGISVYTYT